eukprot:NODE_118_length_18285_cov_1.016606.p6 type:complete len:468 gc:universal NODE_118_length_18285_cov_1.016606:10474-11877(+)
MLLRFSRLASKIIKVPSMGDSISEGTLKGYNKKIGDFVTADEEIAQVETDKVDVPINSPFAGKLVKFFAEEDTTVLVGQDLLEIDTEAKNDVKIGSEVSKQKIEEKSTKKDESPDLKISFSTNAKISVVKVPSLADSIKEGTLKEWAKKEGEYVSQDELLASVETDKVDVPINSPTSGTLKKILVQENTKVTVGENIAEIDSNGQPNESASFSKKPSTSSLTTPAEKPTAKVVEPKPVIKSDQSKPLKDSNTSALKFSRSEERVKMTRMRLKIAERLKESQNSAASLTTFNEIDMSKLSDLRKSYKDAVLKKYDIKLGFMSAFLKASALSMKDIPEINAVISKDEIVYRDYVDISFAVATPKGLVTPVIRNCESKSLVDIEKEVALLGEKAKKNQITLEDLAGGTFTVSNGGVFGSLYGTPIINLPQSAILGMHAIKERPVAINGEVSYFNVGCDSPDDVCCANLRP